MLETVFKVNCISDLKKHDFYGILFSYVRFGCCGDLYEIAQVSSLIPRPQYLG